MLGVIGAGVIVRHRHAQRVPRLKSIIATTRQAAMGLVGSGVRLQAVEVVQDGVVIRAQFVKNLHHGIVLMKPLVRMQAVIGANIVAGVELARRQHRRNVRRQHHGTATTRQAVQGRGQTGACHNMEEAVIVRHPNARPRSRRKVTVGGVVTVV